MLIWTLVIFYAETHFVPNVCHYSFKYLTRHLSSGQMDTGKLISSWMTRILAISVGIFLALYFLPHNVAFFLLSVENSTIIGFSSEKANNNNITLQPEVVISNLEVGRARYDNQRIVWILCYFKGNKFVLILEVYINK